MSFTAETLQGGAWPEKGGKGIPHVFCSVCTTVGVCIAALMLAARHVEATLQCSKAQACTIFLLHGNSIHAMLM